jgi:hypothetical protein
MNAKYWIFISILMCAVAIQLVAVAYNRRPSGGNHDTLEHLWTEKLAYLNANDLDLAGSPEEWAKVREGLNFTDYIYKSVELNGRLLNVYVASWDASTMAPRLVQGHTPDVCWVRVGWDMISATESFIDSKDEKWLVEDRQFKHDGVIQYVKYWHILGGKSFTYGKAGLPPWWATFLDLFKYGTRLRSPHVFVRLSSTVPLESMLSGGDGAAIKNWTVEISRIKSSAK